MVSNPSAQKFTAYGATIDAIQKRYGGLAAVSRSIVTLGVTAVQIVPFDPERIFLAIVNLSIDTVFVSPDPSVSLTRGILLGSNGGLIVMNERDDSLMPALDWYGVGVGAADVCYILSIRRDVATGKDESK